MSRNIPAKSSVTMTTEEISLRKTENGKVLFTAYQNRNCSMLLQDDRLVSVSFMTGKSSKLNAIFIGKIKNISTNINACFVEIAKGEMCFLPLQKASKPYLLNRPCDGRLLQGDEILVQIERDAQKSKLASVTAHISLANEYFSLTLGECTDIRYSSKLSPSQKEKIGNILENQVPVIKESIKDASAATTYPDFEILVRTKTGECESEQSLTSPLFALVEELAHLLSHSKYLNCFTCVKEAIPPFGTFLNQLDSTEYQEIVTDNPDMYPELIDYCKANHLDKPVRLYQDKTLSLSAVYSLTTKMDIALERRVWLKSGGYLIIEPTEALTVIDVNTGKYEAKKCAEESYLKINLEAAEEIARQLRVRNLSGIIIVDFINLRSKQDKTELLNYLKTLVTKDKIQTTVVDMTPLGLVEITRKKVNPTLAEQYKIVR